ncbi:MAG: hypothetical protein A3E79_16490 [Burkholderiales bacterium RIFCSPHIGHO2_12_FULL_61_11]|nr:MAG: hypothetical protein A3E79_16490 [Burkholderiales bacterium RIFCSPHIGHO2_12_FULL_61_11]
MSNADTPSFPDFGKLVPGFDFLQNLTKQAAGSTTKSAPQLPNLGGWLAPTLNVEELDKRIQELKTVQFWLDQNATALKATIQALELQKMTLATLKGMNFSMSEVANAFTLKVADSESGKAPTFSGLEIPPSAFQASQASAAHRAEPEAEVSVDAGASQTETEPDKTPAAVAGMVDPMQWWGALTQQFQTIAAEAMKEAAKKAAMDSSTQAWPQPAADKTSMRPAAKAAPKSKTKARAKAKAPARKAAG